MGGVNVPSIAATLASMIQDRTKEQKAQLDAKAASDVRNLNAKSGLQRAMGDIKREKEKNAKAIEAQRGQQAPAQAPPSPAITGIPGDTRPPTGGIDTAGIIADVTGGRAVQSGTRAPGQTVTTSTTPDDSIFRGLGRVLGNRLLPGAGSVVLPPPATSQTSQTFPTQETLEGRVAQGVLQRGELGQAPITPIGVEQQIRQFGFDPVTEAQILTGGREKGLLALKKRSDERLQEAQATIVDLRNDGVPADSIMKISEAIGRGNLAAANEHLANLPPGLEAQRRTGALRLQKLQTQREQRIIDEMDAREAAAMLAANTRTPWELSHPGMIDPNRSGQDTDYIGAFRGGGGLIRSSRGSGRPSNMLTPDQVTDQLNGFVTDDVPNEDRQITFDLAREQALFFNISQPVMLVRHRDPLGPGEDVDVIAGPSRTQVLADLAIMHGGVGPEQMGLSPNLLEQENAQAFESRREKSAKDLARGLRIKYHGTLDLSQERDPNVVDDRVKAMGPGFVRVMDRFGNIDYHFNRLSQDSGNMEERTNAHYINDIVIQPALNQISITTRAGRDPIEVNQQMLDQAGPDEGPLSPLPVPSRRTVGPLAEDTRSRIEAERVRALLADRGETSDTGVLALEPGGDRARFMENLERLQADTVQRRERLSR